MNDFDKAMKAIQKKIDDSMKVVQSDVRAQGITISNVGFVASNIMILMFDRENFQKADSFFQNYSVQARITVHENVNRISLIY